MSQDAPAVGPGVDVEPPADPEYDTGDGLPPGSRLGLVVAAVIALAASAGLAWWFAAPDRSADVRSPPPQTAAAPSAPKAETPTPLRFAGADPDPNQVRQAWGDVRQGYADGGPAALVRASQACASSVPTQPQRLDYCLAYDIYASAVAPEGGEGGDWFAAAGDRDLALARTALPEGVSPDNRLAQVASLTKAVLPKVAPPRPKPQAVRAVRRPSGHVKPHKMRHRRAPARHAKPVRAHALRGPVAPTPPTRDDFLTRGPPREDPLDPPH